MAAVIREFGPWFQSSVLDYLDPRSEDWWLSFSPLVPITTVCAYMLVVLKLGPRFMAKREPFRIEPVVVVYNAVQVAVCFYIFLTGCIEWPRQNYDFRCQPVDKSINEHTVRIANFVYIFYILKLSDLLDTVFFILRKKFNQASFLHVYHHAGMIIVAYLGTRFSLNGHFTSIGILNSFVHVVMYSYYLYTALLQGQKVPLVIKKSLTTLQLVQFCIFAVHAALPLLDPSCQVQKFWCYVMYTQSMCMIAMFMDFYQKAYLRPRKKATGEE